MVTTTKNVWGDTLEKRYRQESEMMRKRVEAMFGNHSNDVIQDDDCPDMWQIREQREMNKSRARDFKNYISPVDIIRLDELNN